MKTVTKNNSTADHSEYSPSQSESSTVTHKTSGSAEGVLSSNVK